METVSSHLKSGIWAKLITLLKQGVSVILIAFVVVLMSTCSFLKVDCDCWRSRSKRPNRGWHCGRGLIDAIDFQTSSKVFLRGYRLWGVKSRSTTYQVTIRLYRGSSMMAEKTGSYNTRPSVKTFEVHFSQEISIRAGLLYTATAEIKTSTRTFAHSDGMSSATCSGVTVTFKSSSKDNNGSKVNFGQIPALIFRSSSC